MNNGNNNGNTNNFQQYNNNYNVKPRKRTFDGNFQEMNLPNQYNWANWHLYNNPPPNWIPQTNNITTAPPINVSTGRQAQPHISQQSNLSTMPSQHPTDKMKVIIKTYD